MDDPKETKLPTADQLESLFVNNPALEKIEAYCSRFNPIRVMRMERMEIRHSAILSWLLSPHETHGLSDRFLRAFLAEALRGQRKPGFPTALDILHSDLRDVEVRREWQNIDIFIYHPEKRWAFVIENKFDQKARTEQLSGYVKKAWTGLSGADVEPTIWGIFLTRTGDVPSGTNFAHLTYQAICDLLSAQLTAEAAGLTPEVRTFLHHYLELLQEEYGMTERQAEMERLARELYREHRKALDFIFEHGTTTDFENAIRQVFGEDVGWGKQTSVEKSVFVFSGVSASRAGFLPAEWTFDDRRAAYRLGCENWWLGQPLIMFFHLWRKDGEPGGALKLYAEVGPIADHSTRVQLIEVIKKQAQCANEPRIDFAKSASEPGSRYSKFAKLPSRNVKDVQNSDAIVSAIRALLADAEPVIDVVAAAINSLPVTPGSPD